MRIAADASRETLGFVIASLDGTLTLTDKLTAVVRLPFASPADADRLVQTVTPMLGGARAMFERLDARAEDTVVRSDVVATEAQLRAARHDRRVRAVGYWIASARIVCIVDGVGSMSST